MYDANALPLTPQQTVNEFTPLKTKSTNVKMNIILKDESAMYSNPRRLPINERVIVENQIDQWLKDEIVENS